jgi:hypothetical protein
MSIADNIRSIIQGIKDDNEAVKSEDPQSYDRGLNDFMLKKERLKIDQDAKETRLRETNIRLLTAACELIWGMMNEDERKEFEKEVSEFKSAAFDYIRHINPTSIDAAFRASRVTDRPDLVVVNALLTAKYGENK